MFFQPNKSYDIRRMEIILAESVFPTKSSEATRSSLSPCHLMNIAEIEKVLLEKYCESAVKLFPNRNWLNVPNPLKYSPKPQNQLAAKN